MQRVLQPKPLADSLRGLTLINPDFVGTVSMNHPYRGLSFRIRRTVVRPIWSWRAIAALLIPARKSLRTFLAFNDAVGGLPSCFPFSRAWTSPVRTRSRKISLSNSAKTASNPAIARPDGVVRSIGKSDHEQDRIVCQDFSSNFRASCVKQGYCGSQAVISRTVWTTDRSPVAWRRKSLRSTRSPQLKSS